ncbi:MAG: type II toxin-antitoxin system VapC family toxin [Lachnospiraceae bacterium]|nr:type II toxin-antitoxin system VapC family toxin [Lachnospiraceae bacterium]
MLDTNAIIMAIRHPEGKLLARMEKHIGKDLCISVITLGEMEYGAKKSRDPEKTRLGIYQFLAGIPVLDFDTGAARHFGDIYGDLEMKGMRIGDRDTMIAGHARSLGYTVVTNNVGEFSRVEGLMIEDWSV